jgi:hypothetical protein
MARPLTEIKKEDFEKLCQIQCTKIEICGWFNCSESTIERWCKRTYSMSFDAIYDQKRQGGCISLRRAQFQEALKGNTALLIWLGKQYLGQSDVEKAERKLLGDKINEIHEQINVLKLVKEG